MFLLPATKAMGVTRCGSGYGGGWRVYGPSVVKRLGKENIEKTGISSFYRIKKITQRTRGQEKELKKITRSQEIEKTDNLHE